MKKILLVLFILNIKSSVLWAVYIDDQYIHNKIPMEVTQNEDGTTSLTANTTYDFDPYCDNVYACYDWQLFKDGVLVQYEYSYYSTKTFTITESGKYNIAVIYKRLIPNEWYIYIDESTPKNILNCQMNATITDMYSTLLTESNTWIVTSGQTTISNNADVRLDADPVNGYVELKATNSNDFFLSSPSGNGVFIAQALDGCGEASPSRIGSQASGAALSIVSENVMESEKHTFSLYPNPTKTGYFIIELKEGAENSFVEVYNASGKRLRKASILYGKIEIDISDQPNGIYFIKVTSKDKVNIGKIIKE